MAYSGNTLPLTGAGDATAIVGADVVGGISYQAIKLLDGTEGSTVPVPAKGTTPGSTDHGMVVRNIASTAFPQSVLFTSQPTVSIAGGTVSISSGTVTLSSQHTVTAELSSAGSTRLVGQVTVANPTTAVSLSSAIGITSGSSAVELTSVGSTRQVGTVNQGTPAGSSADAWWVRTVSTQTGSGGSTAVDATLTSGGSSRQVGTVNQGTPANSSADAWWVRTVTTGSAGGSTIVDITTSTATRLAAAQGPGSSANYWVFNPVGFTSALTSRTTANTSVNAAVSSPSSAVLAMIIQNMTTVDVGLALSTNAPTTALANIDLVMSGRQIAGGGSYLVFGGWGLPLYTGSIRGITIGSTIVSGGVVITRFLSS